MNKIELLKLRRAKLLDSGKEIRDKISEIIDENSFVELDGYSFSKNDFYDEEIAGEGVVTGYATIGGNPVYVIAQNISEKYGGVSLANCKKIRKCQEKALESGFPVIYLLESLGVQVGEGVNVLEGIADVMRASSELKATAVQISVVLGKVYGSTALLAANSDFCFALKGAEICYASPLVIAASQKCADAGKVAGAANFENNGICSGEIETLGEAREKIISVLDMAQGCGIVDTDDDLNRASENLNEKCCPKCIVDAVFDDGKFFETNPAFSPEVKTGLGRIGGINVAAIIFGGGEKGVELDVKNVVKIKEFANFAAENSLPLVTFVNTLPLKEDVATNATPVLKEVCGLIDALNGCMRLSVIYGKAVGLGYTLFAAKSSGIEYSYAFANAKVALFDGKASSIAFGEVREDKLDKFEEIYSEENADPINAAKNGYIDNVIEPAFVRSYVISALQMMVR